MLRKILECKIIIERRYKIQEEVVSKDWSYTTDKSNLEH